MELEARCYSVVNKFFTADQSENLSGNVGQKLTIGLDGSETFLFCREIFCGLSFSTLFATNFKSILILLWIIAVTVEPVLSGHHREMAK